MMTTTLLRISPSGVLWTLTRKAVAGLDGQLFTAVVFSLKTYAAALLALFLSFWLELDQPAWALLTVYLVAQPDSGLVLAKSVFRLLGTIAGTLVAIAMVLAFSQYGELFLTSLAIWIGLCNFAARAERNFASYAFLLAGYTAGIVGIPAALSPDAAYPIMLARFTEISLGIACAALVSRLILPRELTPKVAALVRALTQRVHRLAEAAADPARDRKRLAAERVQLVKDFATDEAMRSSAFFESSEARLQNETLRGTIDAARHLAVIAGNAVDFEQAAGYPEKEPQTLASLLSMAADTPRGNGMVVSTLVHAEARRSLDDARVQLRQAEAAFNLESATRARSTRGPLWSDPVAAGLMGVRSALAVAVTSGFWIATAWPSGGTAIVFAVSVSSLLASTEQPVKISLAVAVGLVVAAVPLFATLFYLLPLASDFPSMAAALAPLLLACGFIMAQPGIGPIGLFVMPYFSVVSNINNVMVYDAVGFLNNSLASLIGIGVSLVLFATFFPETPVESERRFRRQLLVQLSRLAVSRHSAVEAYARALCERLGTILGRVKDAPLAERTWLVSAAAALSTAFAIDRLRTATAADQLPPDIAVAGSSLLIRISRTCLRPSRARFTKHAWEARALRRRALAAARAMNDGPKVEALGTVVVGCEALRSGLLKMRLLLPDNSDVR